MMNGDPSYNTRFPSTTHPLYMQPMQPPSTQPLQTLQPLQATPQNYGMYNMGGMGGYPAMSYTSALQEHSKAAKIHMLNNENSFEKVLERMKQKDYHTFTLDVEAKLYILLNDPHNLTHETEALNKTERWIVHQLADRFNFERSVAKLPDDKGIITVIKNQNSKNPNMSMKACFEEFMNKECGIPRISSNAQGQNINSEEGSEELKPPSQPPNFKIIQKKPKNGKRRQVARREAKDHSPRDTAIGENQVSEEVNEGEKVVSIGNSPKVEGEMTLKELEKMNRKREEYLNIRKQLLGSPPEKEGENIDNLFQEVPDTETLGASEENKQNPIKRVTGNTEEDRDYERNRVEFITPPSNLQTPTTIYPIPQRPPQENYMFYNNNQYYNNERSAMGYGGMYYPGTREYNPGSGGEYSRGGYGGRGGQPMGQPMAQPMGQAPMGQAPMGQGHVQPAQVAPGYGGYNPQSYFMQFGGMLMPNGTPGNIPYNGGAINPTWNNATNTYMGGIGRHHQ